VRTNSLINHQQLVRGNAEVLAEGFDDPGCGVVVATWARHGIEHMLVNAGISCDLCDADPFSRCELFDPIPHVRRTHNLILTIAKGNYIIMVRKGH